MLKLRNLANVACLLFSMAAGASNDPLGTILLPKTAKMGAVQYSVTSDGQLLGRFKGNLVKPIPTGDHAARELLQLDGRVWVTLSQPGNPDERYLFEIVPEGNGDPLGRLAKVNGLEITAVTLPILYYLPSHPVIAGGLLALVALQQGYQVVNRSRVKITPAPVEPFDGPEKTQEGATLRVHEVLFGHDDSVSDVVVKDFAGKLYSLRTGFEMKEGCRVNLRNRAQRAASARR